MVFTPFEETKVCHDELDAVTAALVGQFFISGYYEALGIPEENDMIIPQRTYREQPYSAIIGVCDSISAGKTEVASYIGQKGFSYIRYSQILAQRVAAKNEVTNRAMLQKEGWGIFNGDEQYTLNKHLEEQIKDAQYAVIDGMRQMEDYTYWKERCFRNFFLIYVDTDYSIREMRYASLHDTSVEYPDALVHPVESHILALRSKADYIVENNSTKEALYRAIDKILDQIKNFQIKMR